MTIPCSRVGCAGLKGDVAAADSPDKLVHKVLYCKVALRMAASLSRSKTISPQQSD